MVPGCPGFRLRRVYARSVLGVFSAALICQAIPSKAAGHFIGELVKTSPHQTHSLASVTARLAAQNTLFRQQWDDDLKASPETATAYGDYRYNDRLDDYSIAGLKRQNQTDRMYRARLAAISTEGFSDEDRLSHDLLLHVLDQRIADYQLKLYEMPISQMEGIHRELAELPGSAPFDTAQHYQDYISRLHQIPKAFEQVIDVLRQGEKDGLMPPRILLEQIPAQCESIVKDDPFIKPTQKFPASIDAGEQRQLAHDIEQVTATEVLPAYQRFADFVAKDYAPHGRDSIGMSSLPNGAALYRNAIRKQTTTDMTAADIHAMGLSEVARINGLLTALAHQAGYPDLQHFRAAINNDSRYIPASADAIVNDFRHYVAQMQPRLAKLFSTYPKEPLIVEAMPATQPGNISHYIPGTPDGSRPGRIVVATSDYAHRRLISDETIAYHEGVPGHHLQISLQHQLKGLPSFRLHQIYTAYAEGWAVYAEALGKEVGFFQDPVSDYGRLNTELMRAVRLVVDTGIHAQGWTRDRAVVYFRESGAADEPTIQAEVDRYIAWPAQGLSYKVGQLKILELRLRAQQKLGARFDIKAFHDVVLSSGSLPLDVLEARVEEWIRRQS